MKLKNRSKYVRKSTFSKAVNFSFLVKQWLAELLKSVRYVVPFQEIS